MEKGDFEAALSPTAELGSVAARQCARLSRIRGAFRRRRPLSGATSRLPIWRCATLAGRRGEPPHVFIDVRKPRLDFLTPAALAGAWEAACASTTSAKKCFYEHDYGPLEHPDHRIRGRDGCQSIESRPSIAGNHRRYAGPGVEKPNLDAHRRDCSRWRLRPNPDRFGHLVSRAPSFALSGETRGEGGVAAITLACTANATKGSCDARLPRRSPAFTNPRGLPLPGRPEGRWRILEQPRLPD